MAFMLEVLWRIPGSRYEACLFPRTAEVLDSLFHSFACRNRMEKVLHHLFGD